MGLSREGMGLYIYDRRRALHLTQQELGERVGATGPMVSDWERGVATPTTDKVIALVDALGCSPNELLGWPWGATASETA